MASPFLLSLLCNEGYTSEYFPLFLFFENRLKLGLVVTCLINLSDKQDKKCREITFEIASDVFIQNIFYY